MQENLTAIERVLGPGVREGVRPVLFRVLDKYCQSVDRRWSRRAALSALLLFRIGRSVFQDDASAYTFLLDIFRAYSPEIRRGAQGDPELSGLVSLTGAFAFEVFLFG